MYSDLFLLCWNSFSMIYRPPAARVTRCQKATSGTESMFVWDNVGHVNVMLTHELSTGAGWVHCGHTVDQGRRLDLKAFGA